MKTLFYKTFALVSLLMSPLSKAENIEAASNDYALISYNLKRLPLPGTLNKAKKNTTLKTPSEGLVYLKTIPSQEAGQPPRVCVYHEWSSFDAPWEVGEKYTETDHIDYLRSVWARLSPNLSKLSPYQVPFDDFMKSFNYQRKMVFPHVFADALYGYLLTGILTPGFQFYDLYFGGDHAWDALSKVGLGLALRNASKEITPTSRRKELLLLDMGPFVNTEAYFMKWGLPNSVASVINEALEHLPLPEHQKPCPTLSFPSGFPRVKTKFKEKSTSSQGALKPRLN